MSTIKTWKERVAKTVINHAPLADDDVLLYTATGAERVYPRCKGKNCGCTDGVSHSEECLAEHEDATNPMVDGKRMYADITAMKDQS